MDIVIVSEFSESFAKDDNDRFLYLAKMLSEKHETELVTSSTSCSSASMPARYRKRSLSSRAKLSPNSEMMTISIAYPLYFGKYPSSRISFRRPVSLSYFSGS